jgi:hypothetical protein
MGAADHPVSLSEQGLLERRGVPYANRKRGTAMVRKMIRDDISRFDDLGARAYARDLREVLNGFESAVGSGQ